MNNSKVVFFFLLVLIASGGTAANVSQVTISSGWRFHRVGSTIWYPAKVPGDVYQDLMMNNQIPDPFFGDNESKVQWVDTCDWEYSTIFECADSLLSHDKVSIDFDGLDTYAEISLNGHLVLTSDNMFRTWTADVKSLIKKNKNELIVRFTAATRKTAALAAAYPYLLPGGDRVFARKAAFQFGWDFGPKLVGCGIWKPVRLTAWSNFRVEDVQVVQRSLRDSSAEVRLRINVNALQQADALVTVRAINDEQRVQTARHGMVVGSQIMECDFKISHAKRWWTHQLGEPFCYNLEITVDDRNGHVETTKVIFGLRELELVQSRDSSGKSFYFKLNGVPVFMKGANMVPLDHLVARIDSQREERLVRNAVESNMNMIRVWGGGIYPSDHFYEMCDRSGLLIWQDFMAACSMIPADSLFMTTMQLEVKEQVVRLRNHPSLAIWCGNNEADEGWHNWGWQKEFKYSAADSARVWADYLAVFEKMIPDVIHTTDPSRFYWPSSPSIGWGKPASLRSGDCHYWGVWWGMEPFEMYEKKTGRFMTEYGFQGMPSMASFKEFTGTLDLERTMPAVKSHEKHPTGFETIQQYLDRSYLSPKNFSEYVYVTQLLQRDGILQAITAHRRSRPYCMGTLYWQLNDSWPGISWSSIDYYGRWKALQFAVKEAYATFLLAPVCKDRKVDIYVVSDSSQDYLARMDLRLFDLKGNLRWSEVTTANMKANASTLVCSRDLSRFILPYDTNNMVLNIRIYKSEKILAESNTFFAQPKNLRLKRPAMTIHELPAQNGHKRVEMKVSVFAKGVELSYENDASAFDRNYIDMMPDERYEFILRDTELPADFVSRLTYRTLIDTY